MFKKLLPAVVALALITTACGSQEGEGEATPEENAGQIDANVQEATESIEQSAEEVAPVEATETEATTEEHTEDHAH